MKILKRDAALREKRYRGNLSDDIHSSFFFRKNRKKENVKTIKNRIEKARKRRKIIWKRVRIKKIKRFV